MLVTMLLIWMLILGIRLSFHVLSFAGRIVLGILGAVILLPLSFSLGLLFLAMTVPVLLLVFLI